MKKNLALFLNLLMFTQLIGVAMENKIKFDNETYNLSVNTENGYNYYLKGENSDNWHSKLSIENLSNEQNPTEASAEFAHQVQAENPSASVLVYPDAATAGYLTASKDYYEYSAIVFQKAKRKGVDKFSYSKRFYVSEFKDNADARKNAIEFAQSYNKKYMELVNKIAPKYKSDN